MEFKNLVLVILVTITPVNIYAADGDVSTSSDTVSEINTLVKKLDSDDYEIRESAFTPLVNLGKKDISILREKLQSKGLSVSAKIILDEAYTMVLFSLSRKTSPQLLSILTGFQSRDVFSRVAVTNRLAVLGRRRSSDDDEMAHFRYSHSPQKKRSLNTSVKKVMAKIFEIESDLGIRELIAAEFEKDGDLSAMLSVQKTKQALGVLSEKNQLSKNFSDGMVKLFSDDFEAAVESFKAVTTKQPTNYLALYYLSVATAKNGNDKEAQNLLAKSVDAGFSDYHWIEDEKAFASFSESKEFAEIVKNAKISFSKSNAKIKATKKTRTHSSNTIHIQNLRALRKEIN